MCIWCRVTGNSDAAQLRAALSQLRHAVKFASTSDTYGNSRGYQKTTTSIKNRQLPVQPYTRRAAAPPSSNVAQDQVERGMAGLADSFKVDFESPTSTARPASKSALTRAGSAALATPRSDKFSSSHRPTSQPKRHGFRQTQRSADAHKDAMQLLLDLVDDTLETIN